MRGRLLILPICNGKSPHGSFNYPRDGETMSRQLAEMLLKDKLISPAQLAEAIEVGKSGKSCVRYLIEKKYLIESKLLFYLSQKFGLHSINIAKFEMSPEVLKYVSPEIAK